MAYPNPVLTHPNGSLKTTTVINLFKSMIWSEGPSCNVPVSISEDDVYGIWKPALILTTKCMSTHSTKDAIDCFLLSVRDEVNKSGCFIDFMYVRCFDVRIIEDCFEQKLEFRFLYRLDVERKPMTPSLKSRWKRLADRKRRAAALGGSL